MTQHAFIKKIFFTLSIFLIPGLLKASGVDLTLYYGSRYVSLGGQQIALANDGYAPFYNPAAMAFAPDNSAVINSTNLLYQFEAPIGAANNQRTSQLHHAPLFYIGSVYKFTDFISFGLGVYPTALMKATFKPVDYGPVTNKEWSLTLARIEVAPSISFKFTDHVAVGVSYRPAFTQYDSHQGTFGVPIGLGGDSSLDSSHNGWDGKGLKIGAHVHDVKGFSGGITYRPSVVHTFEGQTTVTTGAGSTVYPSSRKIHIPAQLQVGISYHWTPQFLTAVTYEFTESEVVATSGLRVPALNNLGVTTDTPLNWRNGHNIHIGSEYTWQLENENHFRLGAGIVVDSAVTDQGKPVPGIGPDSTYIGYALGGQMKHGNHEMGMAFNYQQYQHRTTTVDSDVSQFSIFAGKYSLYVVTLLADYQFHF